MSYSPPTITASGTTFSQFQTYGPSGQLEKIISTNSGSLNGVVLNLLRSPENDQMQQIWDHFKKMISTFNQGEPMAAADVTAQFLNIAYVFAIYYAMVNEMGVLIDAHPGTLHISQTPIGSSQIRRTWP